MGSKKPMSVIQLMMDARGKARSVPARENERCQRPVRGEFINSMYHIFWARLFVDSALYQSKWR